jgi:hypothetical protein
MWGSGFSRTPWFAIWKYRDRISSTKEILLMIDIENFQKKSKTWRSGQTDRTYKLNASPRK